MVKEITMYTVICDNCGKNVNDGQEIIAWNDKNYAESIAIEANWIKEDDKHYCDTCYYYDDDDNLVIKPKEGGNNE